MEDVTPPEPEFPMPEAGHDPDDPLRPEEEEEDLPNPPISAPHQDVEATDEQVLDPDLQSDNDNESALSDLDDAEFEDFDPTKVAIDDRPVIAVDESNVGLIGVHKRKRAEGEDGLRKKKKREGRREKPKKSRKRRDEDEPFSGGEELEGKRARKRKEGGGERRPRKEKTPENEDHLTPEERRRRALNRAMDEALRGPNKRKRRQDGIDLESMQDAEIESMRTRMTKAAQDDTAAREAGQPAYHKLKLLPEVVELLNRNTIQHNLVDPDINLLEAVRFFLEPLNDGSMPAHNIQRDLFASVGKLPVTKDALVASGLGKVAWFYTKTSKCEPSIKRAAEKLLSDWTRPILHKSGDYKKGAIGAPDSAAQALPYRRASLDTKKAMQLETPNLSNRARAAVGAGSYTIAPQSTMMPSSQYARAPGASGDDAFRRMKARQMGKLGGGSSKR